MSHKIFIMSVFCSLHLCAMLEKPALRPEQCTFKCEKCFRNDTVLATFRLTIVEDGKTTDNIARIDFTYDTQSKVGHIDHLDVNPEYRRRGCATFLLTHILDILQRKNMRIVHLLAAPREKKDLPWLVKFYQSHGFQVDEPCEDTDTPLENILGYRYMHKNLYSEEESSQH